MEKPNFVPYRVSIVALGLLTLGAQVFVIPTVASRYGAAFPELSTIQVPYAVAAIVVIAGFQVALIAAWRILSLIESGRATAISSDRLPYVLACSLVFSALVGSGISFHATFIAEIGGPPVLFGLVFALSMIPTFLLVGRNVKRQVTLIAGQSNQVYA